MTFTVGVIWWGRMERPITSGKRVDHSIVVEGDQVLPKRFLKRINKTEKDRDWFFFYAET